MHVEPKGEKFGIDDNVYMDVFYEMVSYHEKENMSDKDRVYFLVARILNEVRKMKGTM